MRWNDEERRVFYTLWGHEAPPTGWNLWVERASHFFGEGRALACFDVVVIGGDPVLATLALRAFARTQPSGRALWVPPPRWSDAPFVWLASPLGAARAVRLLGEPGDVPLGRALAQSRLASRALLDTHGGGWWTARGRLVHAPVVAGRMFALFPDRAPVPAQEARQPWEHTLAALSSAAAREGPFWPRAARPMTGGRTGSVWRLSRDPGEKEEDKADSLVDLSLPLFPLVSISEAQAFWWAAAERLASAPRFP